MVIRGDLHAWLNYRFADKPLGSTPLVGRDNKLIAGKIPHDLFEFRKAARSGV